MGEPAAEIDWADYAPLPAGVTGALRDATRDAAEAYFASLMAARAARVAALSALVARHGVTLEPAPLGAWLVAVLGAAGRAALTGPDADRWTGLVADVALWLGERLIARTGTLRWELFTSHKKATGYQRPVLTGFTKVADRFYYVDIAFMVASWADLAAKRRLVKPDFLATVEAVTLADA